MAEWRIDRSRLKEALGARSRLRAPCRVLKALFSDEGDTTNSDDSKVSTGWVLKKKGGAQPVFVHDRQDSENRKFNVESFRARPHYEWFVDAKDDATLKEFCTWVSKEVIRRVEAEPQPKRLTATAKEKVNAAIAKGKSVQDAMKAHAEWEIITPAAEAYKWPVKDPGKDDFVKVVKPDLKLVAKDKDVVEEKEGITDSEPPSED